MKLLLRTEDVQRRYGVSRRWVYERTRRSELPHRILPHSRLLLFEADWLDAFDDGAELERVELPAGGRIVRPIASETNGSGG